MILFQIIFYICAWIEVTLSVTKDYIKYMKDLF